MGLSSLIPTHSERKLAVIDQVARKSREHFISGYYCAESVLLAVSEAKGIQSELIPKIASGFCSGMARTGGQCGALSGAIMSISLMTGRSSPGASLDKAYAKVKTIRSMFEQKFGDTGCSELLGLDLDTDEGQQAFLEKDLIENCHAYTEEATRMAMTLLGDKE
jgi:C_GCAxxG_C_C family probable redox protein